jgi:hypothetical protein
MKASIRVGENPELTTTTPSILVVHRHAGDDR